MRELWARFVRKMAHQEVGTSLALFRIGIGLVVLLEIVSLRVSGAEPLVWRGPADGGFHDVSGSNWLIHLLGGPTGTVIDRLELLVALGAAAVATGLGTRMAALVTLVSLQALFSLDTTSGGGHDRLMTIGLFFLVLAASDTTLSVACRARTGRWSSDQLVPAWPRYLLMYQVAVMYWATGLSKLGAEWWPPGHYLAVYYAVLIPHWARADHSWVAWVAPVLQLGAALTTWWEGTFPLVLVWLWMRERPDVGGRVRRAFVRLPIRTIYLGFGLVVHGTLLALDNLGPFTAITFTFYASLFWPEEWDTLWRAVTRRPATVPAS